MRSNNLFGYSDLLTAFLKWMRNQKIKGFIYGRFLDIGSEKGELVKEFCGFGLDRDPKGPKGRVIQFKIGNAYFPYMSNIFDTVAMVALIEHLDNLIFNLKEIHRILKNGGQLIVTTPSPKAKKLIKLLSFFPLLLDPSGIDHKIYFSRKNLYRLFETIGFRIIYYKTFQFGMNQLIIAKK